jgi:hypothetical protein
MTEELRVVAVLVQHRYEPVLQCKFPVAKHSATHRTVLERAMSRAHRAADALAATERPIEGFDEAPRGLDEHAVAHCYHRADAGLQQRARDRLAGAVGLRALARIQEHHWDIMSAQQRAEFGGEHKSVAAPPARELAVGVALEAQSSTERAGVGAAPVEVQHVVRLTQAAGTLEFLAQRAQRRRHEQPQLHLTRQGFNGLDHGAGAGAVVDMAEVVRPRAYHEHTVRCGQHRHGHRLLVGNPAAHPDRLRTLQ